MGTGGRPEGARAGAVSRDWAALDGSLDASAVHEKLSILNSLDALDGLDTRIPKKSLRGLLVTISILIGL